MISLVVLTGEASVLQLLQTLRTYKDHILGVLQINNYVGEDGEKSPEVSWVVVMREPGTICQLSAVISWAFTRGGRCIRETCVESNYYANVISHVQQLGIEPIVLSPQRDVEGEEHIEERLWNHMDWCYDFPRHGYLAWEEFVLSMLCRLPKPVIQGTRGV